MLAKVQEVWSGGADISWVIDMLYIKLRKLQENESLDLNKNFMMNIFEEYCNELPPFKDYWELIMYEKKQMKWCVVPMVLQSLITNVNTIVYSIILRDPMWKSLDKLLSFLK